MRYRTFSICIMLILAFGLSACFSGATNEEIAGVEQTGGYIDDNDGRGSFRCADDHATMTLVPGTRQERDGSFFTMTERLNEDGSQNKVVVKYRLGKTDRLLAAIVRSTEIQFPDETALAIKGEASSTGELTLPTKNFIVGYDTQSIRSVDFCLS